MTKNCQSDSFCTSACQSAENEVRGSGLRKKPSRRCFGCRSLDVSEVCVFCLVRWGIRRRSVGGDWLRLPSPRVVFCSSEHVKLYTLKRSILSRTVTRNLLASADKECVHTILTVPVILGGQLGYQFNALRFEKIYDVTCSISS